MLCEPARIPKAARCRKISLVTLSTPLLSITASPRRWITRLRADARRRAGSKKSKNSPINPIHPGLLRIARNWSDLETSSPSLPIIPRRQGFGPPHGLRPPRTL